MHVSLKPKTFSGRLITFMKSALNFDNFAQKLSLTPEVLSKLLTAKKIAP